MINLISQILPSGFRCEIYGSYGPTVRRRDVLFFVNVILLIIYYTLINYYYYYYVMCDLIV